MHECKYTHFFTFKGGLPRHQKIGFFADRLKKISKDFLITREVNKIVEGYHFHALAKLTKKPPKNWYRKGIHMHCQELGDLSRKAKDPKASGRLACKVQIPTQKEVEEYVYLLDSPDDAEVLVDYGMAKMRQHTQRQRRKAKHSGHVRRVLKYILKDKPTRQYIDYILLSKGSNLKLPDAYYEKYLLPTASILKLKDSYPKDYDCKSSAPPEPLREVPAPPARAHLGGGRTLVGVGV